MAYEDTLDQISQQSQQQVQQAWANYQAGQLTQAEFEQVTAQAIAASNSRAATLADLSLAAAIATEMATQFPQVDATSTLTTSGLTPDSGEELTRLTKGVHTLLEASKAGDDVTARLTRFAASEPLETAQRTYQQSIKKHPALNGWQRHLSTDACELCVWWWREGRVWPKDHYFQSHKGCKCTPKPFLNAKYIRSTQFTRTGKRTDTRHKEGWNDGTRNTAPAFGL
jgi:hypothetical protein